MDWSEPDHITSEPIGGDTLTVANINRLIRNPEHKWWAFWRPRMIDSGELQTFVIQGK